MKPRSLKDVPYVALPISEVTNLQTEVVGQDGISYAPVNNRKQMQAIRDQIAGWNGNPTDDECGTE
jgi:hypothetical protein